MRHCEQQQLGSRAEKGSTGTSFGALEAARRDLYTRLIENGNKCLHKYHGARIIGAGKTL